MIRFFDVLLSGIAIVILVPFMLPVMIALKLTGEHDIFYRQQRVGRYGKDFGLFKFATMLRNSPNLEGGLYTSKHDPRMLPLGRFLRKTKINELPQLLNVFIGQMSIVGFRPTVRDHFMGYPDPVKQKIYNSRPGLTGIGSIVFRNEEEILQNFNDKRKFHQEVITPYKGALESWYIDNKSILCYFRIIFVTIYVVILPKSSLWKKQFQQLPNVPVELQEYI